MRTPFPGEGEALFEVHPVKSVVSLLELHVSGCADCALLEGHQDGNELEWHCLLDGATAGDGPCRPPIAPAWCPLRSARLVVSLSEG